jgi:hypothetical protein
MHKGYSLLHYLWSRKHQNAYQQRLVKYSPTEYYENVKRDKNHYVLLGRDLLQGNKQNSTHNMFLSKERSPGCMCVHI